MPAFHIWLYFIHISRRRIPGSFSYHGFCLSALFHSKGTLQEVIAWGLLGWKLYANVNGPIHCKSLSSLGVTQIVCSEKGFLILSSSGAVYTQNYKSTTLVSSADYFLWKYSDLLYNKNDC